MLCKSRDRKSLSSPLGCIQLTYTKSIDMLNKNTPGEKKSEAKEEVPCDGLSTNALEYFTRTNLVKIKNAITDKPFTLALHGVLQVTNVLSR